MAGLQKITNQKAADGENVNNMGSAPKKPVPMRSRRSGRKKDKLIAENWKVIKKVEKELKIS